MARRTILNCVLLMVLGGSVWSATIYNEWRGTAGTSDWNTPANWNYGYVPKIVLGADNIRAGFKGNMAVWPVITDTTVPAAEAYNISLGGTAGGTLTIDSGNLNVGQYLFMGVSSGENGTFNINGGTVTTGTFTPSNAHFMIGQAGTGTVNMTGGTVNLTANGATGDLRLAYTSTATGKLNLNGGIIYANNLLMPFAAAGALDISGGTLVLNGDQMAAVAALGGKIIAYHGAGTVQVDYNVTNAGKTTVRGHLAVPEPTNPSPTNNANQVPLETDLSWTAGDGAITHDVYFGTVSPGTFQGNQTITTFDPGTLEYATTYYWRIDERAAGDVVTTGPVWSFSTITGQAINPSPESGSVNVSVNATLSWTGVAGATSRDVYFGTTSPGALQGNQTATTFDPGTLLPNTTYYWRVDEIIDGTPITGNVWSFTTGGLTAYNPSPANAATGVVLNKTLTWSAGASAVSHDVYFGTTSPGTFRGNQAAAMFDPGVLAENTKYYWRIDECDSGDNVTTGTVWSFTTGVSPQVNPYLTWRSDPTTSIMVNWWNPVSTGDSSVDYGLTSSYGSTATVATVTHFHHVELTNLTPATTYHYRIRSSDGTVGPDNTFTTVTVNDTTFSFMVFGDPRGGDGSYAANAMYHNRHRALVNWMLAQNTDFALQTGDIVWEGAILTSDPATKVTVEDYYTTFFDIEKEFSRTKVIMPTMGNHEVQPGGRDYTYYYDMYEGANPANGPAGNRGRIYSFNYGNAHFVCLSSFQISLTSQASWLATDLAVAAADSNIKWIIVFMHAPCYTTDTERPNRTDEIAAWSPLFEQYGVDLVFAGHNHFYERSYSIVNGEVVDHGDGPIYITSGAGGASFNTGSVNPLFATWHGGETLAVKVTINGSYMTVDAIPNSTGVPVDAFQLTPPLLDGDFNEDGTVDTLDLDIFTGNWLETGIWP
ncbi:MAG: metallophosphoesterase [Planctomycetaceae bacterium]|nr:metallophosphoesterase [Planctomycetaceae bacterium]